MTGLEVICAFVYTLGCAVSWGVSCYVFHTYIQERWHKTNWMDYRVLSFFAMWLSWFSVFVGLSGILARHLALNKINQNHTSIRIRLLRLLRIHFSQILDIIFSSVIVVSTLIIYLVMR